MREISVTKFFPEHTLKKFEFEELLTTFPSYGVSLKSIFDLKPFMDVELNGGTKNCSIVTLPVSNAPKVLRYIENNYPMEVEEAFFRRHPIMVDWETEYWYFSNSETEKRKKAFGKIKGKPFGWEKLFSLPEKNITKRKSHHLEKKEYASKIEDFFKDKSSLWGMIRSTMRHAHLNLKSSIVIPPTPLIISTGISLQIALEMNTEFNKFRKTLKLLSACSYNLHHEAFMQESTHKAIVDQLYELTPKIVVISTPDSDNYLKENVLTMKKIICEKFIKELRDYASSHGALIIWLDKGYFTSSYGFRLLKSGIDCFMYPLRGHCRAGGPSDIPPGKRYSNMLDDFNYLSWQRYLEKIKRSGINCHLKCCEKESHRSLKDMIDRQQWVFKRKHELFTRDEQLKQLLEKLTTEGNLRDFEVRLRRNNL